MASQLRWRKTTVSTAKKASVGRDPARGLRVVDKIEPTI
jgi:hypothetical protein